MNAQSAVENNWDAQYMGENRNYFQNIDSVAKNAFINSKGDVDTMLQAVDDFNTCKGCIDDGYRYIQFLTTSANSVSIGVMSGGTTVGIVHGARAIKYLNTMRQLTQNPTVQTFLINGGANATISAIDPNERTINNVTSNFFIGGLAGQLGAGAAAKIPYKPISHAVDVGVQGVSYGIGSLGKNMINENNIDVDEAFKAGLTGSAGAVSGKAFSSGVTLWLPPSSSTTTKTLLEATSGGFGANYFGEFLKSNDDPEKSK